MVTINDIAKAANVSPSTVSRVIAGSSLISDETKKKVKKVMEQLDYYPNMLARSLVNRSTKIVGLLIPESEKAFGLPFYSEILRGIVSSANKSNYKILISNLPSGEDEQSTINELAYSCIVEGFILMTSRLHDNTLKSLTEMDFPFVMVGKPELTYSHKINWVDNDNFEAGYKLTEHFIKKGRTKIAFIGISTKYMVTMDRFNGYLKALKDYNIPFDQDLIINGEFMNNNAVEEVSLLLSRSKYFNGLICSDDYQAFSAVTQLKNDGFRIPEDIAVAGFNNVPQSATFTPSITSVEVHPYELGEKSFELLFRKLNDHNSSCHEYVKTDLLERQSC